MFKCDICNIDFKAKQSLIRHQNKLTKCDHITKFKCNNCNKYFKRKQTLKEHIELVCGIKFINDQLDELNNITNILNLRLTTDAKIDLLIVHRLKLFELDDAKLSMLSFLLIINNINIKNNTNNITHNILLLIYNKNIFF